MIDSVATITDHRGVTHVVEATADPMVSGPCAGAVATRHRSTPLSLKELLSKAETVTADSHYPCHALKPIDDRNVDRSVPFVVPRKMADRAIERHPRAATDQSVMMLAWEH